MKNLFRRFFIYSFTLCASSVALAQKNDFVYIPVLDGGITGSVGALYLVPSSDFESYFVEPSLSGSTTTYDVLNVNPNYSFGIDASLGYIFDDTANAVDLFFRNISTSDSDTTEYETPVPTIDVTGNLGYDLTAFDLMFSQFAELGRYMELRLLAGLAYVELKQNNNTSLSKDTDINNFVSSDDTSKFTGWGPRVGIDARYDFFGGFGLIAGGSAAYYLGKLDTTAEIVNIDSSETATDTQDNHGVMNFRANIALDFVFSTDDKDNSMLGLEFGYLIDYYDDAIGSENINTINQVGTAEQAIATSAVSFSGPYINLKGIY